MNYIEPIGERRGFAKRALFLLRSMLLTSLVLGLAAVISLRPLRAVDLPQPPETFINTNLSATPFTGKSIAVSRGLNLQAAIDGAKPGDEIVLQAGASYEGNFVLRNKSGNGWITIRSSATAQLPASGTRVSPSLAPSMAQLFTSNTLPVISTETGAHQYRLIGLEVTLAPRTPLNYGLIFLGTGGETNTNQLPRDIIFDRMYIHGEVLCHCKSGIQLNGIRAAVVDSYLSDFHGIGQDTQAILAYSTPGPLKIVNNYLEGSGENMMFGGAYSSLPGVVESDLEIRGNYFHKPLGWKTSIIPAPSGVQVALESGGSLTSGQTYWYSVVARGTVGYYTAPGSGFSGISAETAVAATPGRQSVSIAWNPVTYGAAADSRTADSYAVMRSAQAPGTPNRQWQFLQVAANGSGVQMATDRGAALPVWSQGWMPFGYQWEVKNLLEFKNAQRALVEGNLLENDWVNAQAGIAVVFTPRFELPPSPALPPMYQNVVQDITFRYNIVQHAAGAIDILGYDNNCPVSAPCQQTSRILIQDNYILDINQNNGGSGALLTVLQGHPDGSTNVTFDHNTTFFKGNTLQVDLPNGAWVFTNSIVERNTYGVHGDGLAEGSPAFTTDFRSMVFAGNVDIAAPASWYPPGNYFPATADQVEFSGAAQGNFALAAASPYAHAATDGSAVGANMATIYQLIQAASSGFQPAAIPLPSRDTGRR